MVAIGVMGLIGSGKGEFADYVSKKYNYKKITYSDILRKLVRQQGKVPTRKNLQDMRRKTIKEFDEYYVGNLVVEKIKNMKNVVIDGIRLVGDIKPLLKNIDNVILVLIDAPPETRFRRLKKRNSKRDAKTIEEFNRQEKNESELFEFDKIFPMADYTIENNSTLSEFHQKIDKFIRKFSLC